MNVAGYLLCVGTDAERKRGIVEPWSLAEALASYGFKIGRC